MRKIQIDMNRPVYLGLSISDLSKIVMYEFWHDYVKPKYAEKAKLCYTDTDSFIVYIKADDFAEDVETGFGTSNYELKITLTKGKNKKVTGVMKDEFGGKVMKEFVGLRAKADSYLRDDGTEDKKAKNTKKYVIRRKLKFEDYKNSLETNQL